MQIQIRSSELILIYIQNELKHNLVCLMSHIPIRCIIARLIRFHPIGNKDWKSDELAMQDITTFYLKGFFPDTLCQRSQINAFTPST